MRPPARACLLALAALLAVLLVPVAPARAADPQQVSITLRSLSPSVLTEDATLTISATARNDTDRPVYGLQVMLWRDSGTLYTSTDQLQDLADSTATLPVGRRVFDVPGAFTTDLPQELAPGDTVQFSVSAPASALELPAGQGAALVGLHARGTLTAGTPVAEHVTLGRSRTLVPYGDLADLDPVPLASVVLLGSAPSRLADGRFTDGHLAAEIASGGRLDTLLTSAARSGVSWAIDPMLIADLTALASTHQRLDGGESAGDPAAARALERIAALPASAGYRLPWGDPDLASLAHGASPELRSAVISASTAALPEQVADLPLLVHPMAADQAVLDLATELEAQVVVLAAESGSAAYRRTGGDIVYTDASPWIGRIGPDPGNTDVQLRQSRLTATLLQALQPDGSEPAAIRLVDDARSAALDVDASWQRRTPLPELLASAPSWGSDSEIAAAPAGEELPAGQLSQAQELLTGLRTTAEVLGSAADATPERQASAAVSGWWHRTPPADWLRSQREAMADVLSGGAITVSVASPVRLTSRQGVRFPVSVTNTLDVPVTVGVRYLSSNSDRLSVPPNEPVRIDPGQTVVLTGVPSAKANGATQVVARLVSPSGQELGRPASFTVIASNLGWIGWIIVLGSGAVVLGGTVLRIRQVRAQRAREQAAAPDSVSTPTDAGPASPPSQPDAGRVAP